MNILSSLKCLKCLTSIVLCVASLFTSLFFDTAIPHGKELDMAKLELTWSDEFDGNSLNFDKWDGHYFQHGQTIMRRGSYWNTDLATVQKDEGTDGCLHIATKYYPDGLNGNGKPGWYTCGIDTSRCVMQSNGYFECRCILPKGEGLWSAFWLMSDNMGNSEYYGMNGAMGAEIDVFESANYHKKTKFERNSVSSNIHIDGYGENHKMKGMGNFAVTANNPYEEFNTYGLEWTQNEYIFYINGVETGRTEFGVSHFPEWLILSVEVGGENGVPDDSWAGESIEKHSDELTDFVVDYVRMYRFK